MIYLIPTSNSHSLSFTAFYVMYPRVSDQFSYVYYIIWFVCSPGYAYGDPKKLLYPTDSSGNMCGTGDFA